ncbi:MAG: radical SAM protein [Armatimonadota bacterium]|nr:MAG: radical SAM protein [Armatimonadota bacterium]
MSVQTLSPSLLHHIEYPAPPLAERVWVGVKRHALSLMLDQREVYTFDPVGRLWMAYIEEVNYKRGLDGRMVCKWVTADNTRHLRRLSPEESDSILRWAHQMASQALEFFPAEGDPACRSALESACRWDVEAHRRDAQRFLQVYKPVSILPPDQYLALVLQVTQGCHWNRCTFCDFYRDRPFAIQTPEQLREHIAGVQEYFGDTLRLRNRIFLADANALVAPQKMLVPLLQVIREAFPIEPSDLSPEQLQRWREQHPIRFDGLYSFVDAFTGYRKTVAEWRQLQQLGVRRVYIGVETGCEELLRFLRKPQTNEEVLQLVCTLKEAGVGVGIIILLGAGGDYSARAHVTETVALLNRLPWSAGDILYFSELVEPFAGEYTHLAQEAGIQPLSPEQMRDQRREIESLLHLPAGVQRATYDIREFVY